MTGEDLQLRTVHGGATAWLLAAAAGASVDVDTSVWRRRKWARLRWRHDPWGDAATTPAAGEVSYRASNEGPHEG